MRELQAQGLTFRKARAVVKATFDVIRKGLQKDKEVQTPIGLFKVRRRGKVRPRIRFGRKQHIYKRRSVVFKPNPGLRL